MSPVARPLPLHVGERAYLNEMRALSTDREGNEILVGLSFEESEFYLACGWARLLPFEQRSATVHDGGDRYLAVADKHEHARFLVMSAEQEKWLSVPTLN